MKPLHIGLLVIGAALAGGLAMRMAEPPPLPPPSHVQRVQGAPSSPVPAPVVTVPASVPLPPVRRVAATTQQPVIAPAPPPIYSEPPHVEQPIRRTTPVEVAKVFHPALAPVPYQPVVSEPPHVAPRPPHQVVLPAGAPVTVRLIDTLSTDRAVTGDTFQATLADPLIVDGLVVAERGARVTGRVADSRRAGRMSGISSLELRLLDFTTADGQRVPVSCDPWLKRGDSMSRGSAERIGGGAALGTIIGAIAGGGVGAAIGAGAGGTLGAGAAALTGPKAVTIPGETVIRFRLAARLTITERHL